VKPYVSHIFCPKVYTCLYVSHILCPKVFFFFFFLVYFLPILGRQKAALSDSVEGWCAAGNLGPSRCRFAWTTRRMDRGTTGTDDGTGRFRGGFISHPGRQVTPSLYLATVRSHCPSGVRGSFILPLQYIIWLNLLVNDDHFSYITKLAPKKKKTRPSKQLDNMRRIQHFIFLTYQDAKSIIVKLVFLGVLCVLCVCMHTCTY
jgi:hypothetical protein